MRNFADPDRLTAAKESGMSGLVAHLASALPDEGLALRLNASGALDAAHRAFRGDDPGKFNDEEIDGLREYMNLLEPAQGQQFKRYLTTLEKQREAGVLRVDDKGVATGAEISAAVPKTLTKAKGVGDVDAARALDRPDLDKSIVRATRGTPLSELQEPDEAFAGTDKSGRRIQLNPVAGMIMLDNDVEFQDLTKNLTADQKTEAKLAQVMGAWKTAGIELDPESISDILLNPEDGTRIPESVVTRVKNGLTVNNKKGVPIGPLDADTAAARKQTAKTLPRAVDDNQGQADSREIDQIKQENEINSIARRTDRAAPDTLVPIKQGNLREDPGVDAVDKKALAEENPKPPRPRKALIAALRSVVGEEFDTSRDSSLREVYEGIDKKKLTPSKRKELNEAVEAYAEARYAKAVRNNNEAVAAWQKNKNGETNKARLEAELKLKRARRDLKRRLGTIEARTKVEPPPTPKTPDPADVAARAAKKAEAAERAKKAVSRAEGLNKLREAGRARRAEAGKIPVREKKVIPNESKNPGTTPERLLRDPNRSKLSTNPTKAVERSRAEVDFRSAVDTWRANKNPTTFAALQEARRLFQREGKFAGKAAAKIFQEDRSPDGSGSTTKTKAEPKIRSRREIHVAVQEVVSKKGITEAARIEQLLELDNELKAVGESMTEAGQLDAERRIANTTAEKYNKLRDILVGDVTKLSDALKASRNFANDAQKRLIDTILGMGAADNVSFEGLLQWDKRKGTVAGAHRGARDVNSLDSHIIMNFSQYDALTDNNVDPVYVLLHEAVHAMTAHAELRDAKVRGDVRQMLGHARSEAKKMGENPDSWYGLSETQEFLAEAFTNVQFQEMLKKMPPAGTDTFKSLWDQFKAFVAKLLGFQTAEANLLDEIFTVGLEMGRMKQLMRVENVNRLIRGEADNSPTNYNSQPHSFLLALPPEARVKLLAAFAPPNINTAGRPSAWNKMKELVPAEVWADMQTADKGPKTTLDWGVALVMAGKLNLDEARTPVGQLWDNISKTLRIPSKTVYAKQIISDLQQGLVSPKYDMVKRTVGTDSVGKAVADATKYLNAKVAPTYEALLKNIDTRMRAQGIPAMNKLATLLSQRTGEFRSNNEKSLRFEIDKQRGQKLEALGKIINGIDPKDERVLVRSLQSGKPLAAKYAHLTDTRAALSTWLKDMYDYAQTAGVNMGKTADYFPVAMDTDALSKRREAFFELHRAPNFERPIRERFIRWTQDEIDSIRKDDDGNYYNAQDEARAERLYARIEQLRDTVEIDDLIGQLYDMAIYGSNAHYIAGVNYDDPAHKPAFSNAKHRTSNFIFEYGTPEQKAAFSKFQDTNLSKVLVTYTNGIVRRAEWERMGLTTRIQGLKEEAVFEGASAKQMQMMQDYVNQIMGTYNDSWNPIIHRILKAVDRLFDSDLANSDFQKFKAFQTAIQTYNNVRLLPLALASSLVDPLATMVRTGSVAGAFDNLRDGLKAYRDQLGDNELRKMAETLGIIEREGLNEAVAYTYGNVYDPNSRAAKVNNLLFKYNGLEAMTRYNRLVGLAAGHRFLLRHRLGDNETSARYLKELGLVPDDIQENNGMVSLNAKTEDALRRFVEESVVRPHAGQRPSWHNDPNFALAAQYKGYLYAFYETVLKRAGTELQNGNPAVLAPVLLYLPLTAVAEMGRDIAQGDDDDKDISDYMTKGLDRSGLLGPTHGVIQDAATNVRFGNGVLGNVAGATGQQIGDAYDVLTGDGSASSLAVDALPGQALYKEWGE